MKNFYAKLTKVNYTVGQKSQFCSPIIIVEREERKRKKKTSKGLLTRMASSYKALVSGYALFSNIYRKRMHFHFTVSKFKAVCEHYPQV
jgi:hypothetical protein